MRWNMRSPARLVAAGPRPRGRVSWPACWLAPLAAAWLLAGGCYPDRIPEERVRLGNGDGDLGGQGGAMPGDGGGTMGTGGDGTGGDGTGGDGTGGDGTGGSGCVLRVDVSMSGSFSDGLTWGTAFAHPGEAQSHIQAEGLSDCDVWIAEGSYDIVAPGLSFANARLLGGFDGAEELEAERNPEAHEVTLQADGSGVTVLTLQDASAQDLGITGGELGVLVESGSVTLTGVDIFGNSPSGGVIVDTAATLVLSDSRLFQNEALDSSGGGALLARSTSSVTVEDCIFANNRTGGSSGVRRGGAAHLFGLTNVVRRSLFVGNESATDGGALTLGASDWRVEDSVFVGNSGSGSAIDADADGEAVNVTASQNLGGNAFTGDSTIVNSIFWGNAAELSSGVTTPRVYSTLVEGGYSAETSVDILTSDPQFEGTTLDDTSTTISSGSRTSILGHGVSGPPPGFWEGQFLQVTDGAGQGFYYVVDSSSGSLELLGEWGSELTSSSLMVTNLELQATSPALDRGRGDGEVPNAGASALDVLGNARQDLPAVMNNGVGTPPYVDLGAYERQP